MHHLTTQNFRDPIGELKLSLNDEESMRAANQLTFVGFATGKENF
jgi:hypothetical protein